MSCLRRGGLAGVFMALLAGCAREQGGADAARPLTFTKDIAPIVFEHCSGCHHPGGSAPFALIDWQDVRKRAEDLVTATHDRYMPPWLPDAGDVAFAGARGLDDGQIETLRRWVEQGAVEGDPADLPAVPRFSPSWQLGEPDLVVGLREPFTLAAEGGDVFRNFVLPVRGVGARFVRAVEIRAVNPRAVHHAWMTLDQTGSCERLDAADPGSGFAGMDMGASQPPDGHFVGWTPGKMPHAGFADMAWRIADGMDLVLQLHLLPSGKPEVIQPSVGLYFADAPPTKTPFALTLKVTRIDIPPGQKDYPTEQSFTLPVGVELLSLYPHAHYVCRDMQVTATLPDGHQLSILHIGDWDFNWQDQYYLEQPLALPAGTRLQMRYSYDNSASNPRNPWSPPRRVIWGDRSSDEMGSLVLQLLPADRAGLASLHEAACKQDVDSLGTYQAHYNYANLLQARGDHATAISHFREAIELQPELDIIHHNLAGSLAAVGQIDAAIAAMREAIRLDPQYADAHCHLGNFLVTKQDYDAALECYRRALEVDPGHAQARQNHAALLGHLGRGE